VRRPLIDTGVAVIAGFTSESRAKLEG